MPPPSSRATGSCAAAIGSTCAAGTVAITGGSRGLGLVMARQFAAAGAHVCLLARDPEELERAAAQVAASGDAGVATYPCDVRSQADVDRAFADILERRTAIDMLINNAGVIQVGPLEHMRTEDFENAMATHFWGPLYTMQACLPAMTRRGFGRIVNIASIGGRIAVPHLAPYSASKFALVGLSDAVRAEVARHGIRVTTVSPGLMRTGSPGQRRLQGTTRSRVRLVRRRGLDPRNVDGGRARGATGPGCLPLRRSRADHRVARQARCAGFRAGP